MDKNQITVGLCGPGRHEMPVSEFIFPPVVEHPLDFEANFDLASTFLQNVMDDKPINFVLYITGLTPVLTTFLNAWELRNEPAGFRLYDKLTLMHFDRDSGSYKPQVWN